MCFVTETFKNEIKKPYHLVKKKMTKFKRNIEKIPDAVSADLIKTVFEDIRNIERYVDFDMQTPEKVSITPVIHERLGAFFISHYEVVAENPEYLGVCDFCKPYAPRRIQQKRITVKDINLAAHMKSQKSGYLLAIPSK